MTDIFIICTLYIKENLAVPPERERHLGRALRVSAYRNGQGYGFAELQTTDAFRRLFAGAGRLNVSADLQGVKHVLSHQILYTAFYRIEIEREGDALKSYLPVATDDVEKYAVPRLIHIYLEKLEGNLSE